VEDLGPEAGYIEIPGGSYTTIPHAQTSPTQRVFYSYWPADDAPEERPLAVFFNGGPGVATSSRLMALNTGPFTLDPEKTGDAEIAANEHSYTRAFNLLYIDAPMTGFSYALPLEDGYAPPMVFNVDRDAGIFNRVLLFFLERHPGLMNNRVVLIGESYGGVRAGQMLRQLLSPETLLDPGSPYGDPDLYCALQAHMRRVRAVGSATETEAEAGEAADEASADDAAPITVSDIAAQFGHVGLIQPLLLGDLQADHSTFDASVCVPDHDPYVCDMPFGFDDGRDAETARRLLVPENLARVLGIDPTSIAWLDPTLRDAQYLGDGTSDIFSSAAWLEHVGRQYRDASLGAEVLLLLPHLERALITRAELDRVIDSYGFVRAAAALNLTVSDLSDQPQQSERPGVVEIAGEALSGVVTLRMPRYENAGHAVTHRAAGEFFDDLTAWMGP